MPCDFCGNPTYSTDRNNAEDGVSTIETTFSINRKTTYAGGCAGHGDRLTWDICPDCIKGKLLPWIESQGAEVEEDDYTAMVNK